MVARPTPVLAALALLAALIGGVAATNDRRGPPAPEDVGTSFHADAPRPPETAARGSQSRPSAPPAAPPSMSELVPARTVRFRGRIYERRTDRGLAGATVVAVRATGADGYPISRGEREPAIDEVLLARTTTDADGRFVLRPSAESEVELVCVHAAGYVATVLAADEFTSGRGAAVPLDSGVTLRGRIVSDDRVPIAGALGCWGGVETWWQWRIGGTPRSGVDGRYVLVDLLPLASPSPDPPPFDPTDTLDGDTLDGGLAARMRWVPANGEWALEPFPNDKPEVELPDTLDVPREPSVTGVVRDVEGHPIWSAEVALLREGASALDASTSRVSCRRDGTFRVDAPYADARKPVTRWALRIEAPGFRSVERILPRDDGRPRVDVVLDRGVDESPPR